MDQSSRDMVLFCLEFVRNNVSEQSQNVQCRNWIKKAQELIRNSQVDSFEFMIMTLDEADRFFSGVDQSATTNTVLEKLKLVESLLKS